VAVLRHAFKEWAVVCRALGEGRQALILRKGGIDETGGDFRPEHTRFWLFPTFTHQQQAGIVPEAAPLLAHAEAERPPAGVVRLTYFAEVVGLYHLHNLAAALAVDGVHVWSEETVRARFAYRWPGLYLLAVRVYRATEPVDLPDTPGYAGCRTWVELERELPTEGAVPVLGDEAFRDVLRELDRRLKPTAMV
jgi:hypothetical protein